MGPACLLSAVYQCRLDLWLWLYGRLYDHRQVNLDVLPAFFLNGEDQGSLGVYRDSAGRDDDHPVRSCCLQEGERRFHFNRNGDRAQHGVVLVDDFEVMRTLRVIITEALIHPAAGYLQKVIDIPRVIRIGGSIHASGVKDLHIAFRAA